MTNRATTILRHLLALMVPSLLNTYAIAATPGHGIEYGPAQLTNANSRLAISAAEPDAHEPFDLEIFIGRNLIAPPVVDLHLKDNEITVLYRIDPTFSGPYKGDALTLRLHEGLAYGDYFLRVRRLDADGSEPAPELEFSVAEPPGQLSTIGMYAPEINHFFVTASFEEYIAIEPYGWQRLGRGADFKVWPAEGPAPSTARPVCRFYSPLVNSHFYTGDTDECESLKEENSDWTYEGIAFQALLPKAGICPSRTRPIYRLYNDRADELDSNHRFITSAEMYRALVEQGWIGEGIAFCEAPSPPDCIIFIEVPDECQAQLSLYSREGLTG